ncbi:hypothetical protein ACERK3_12765 [Phycisphaerales bacterium AB-hyl4]|uniref:Uncharacterized protein n=1 Tax=Natronomicrosphaera hydrolytica TaxID=3242702 RepID=A0ABV4U8U2_9BACT
MIFEPPPRGVCHASETVHSDSDDDASDRVGGIRGGDDVREPDGAAGLERYERQIERAEQEHAEAVERATTQYRESLERALAGALRSGEAADAQRIQGELDRLNTIPGYSGPSRVRSFLAAIAGRSFTTGTPAAGVATLEADGRFLHSHRSWNGRAGTWSAVSEHEVVIETFDKREWRMIFSEDRNHAVLVLERGRGPTMARSREP